MKPVGEAFAEELAAEVAVAVVALSGQLATADDELAEWTHLPRLPNCDSTVSSGSLELASPEFLVVDGRLPHRIPRLVRSEFRASAQCERRCVRLLQSES